MNKTTYEEFLRTNENQYNNTMWTFVFDDLPDDQDYIVFDTDDAIIVQGEYLESDDVFISRCMNDIYTKNEDGIYQNHNGNNVTAWMCESDLFKNKDDIL